MALAPLPQPTDVDPLKVVRTVRPDPTYRYEMRHNLSCQVFKDNKLTYQITGAGACDCAGFEYRQTCKHSTVARGMVTDYLAA